MVGKRGRPPGSTNRKGNRVVDNLVAALDFIAPAVKDIVYIGPDHVEAFNSVLSIGAPIQSGIERLCPNYELLRAAIKRAGETPSLTKIDEGRLGVTGGKFRAVVPCMPEDQVALADQNEKKYPCDDRIKQGFELLNPIVKEAGKTMIEASLLLQNDTIVATDRHVMFEFKHGINFPRVVLPKQFLNAVINCKKKLIMFGFGEVEGTITFWFEDNSWIQTQLFQEDWPNYLQAFQIPDMQDIRIIPDGMFEAIEALQEFAQDGDVFFGEHSIRSHDNISQGASYEFPHSPVVNVSFNAKRMMLFKEKFTHCIFTNDRAIFYNEQPMIRGAIVQRARMAVQDDRPVPPEMQPQEPPAVQEPAPQGSLEGMPAIPTPPVPDPSPRPPEPDIENQAVNDFPDWVWADDDFEEIDGPARIEGDFVDADIPAFIRKKDFDIDAHNKHAAENMASADPHAVMYPGVSVGEVAASLSSGIIIRDAPE